MRLVRTVFRAHNPKWAWAPDAGHGAAIHGGRFNPVGMKALYTSYRFETAWLEAQQAFPFKAQPMTLVGYDVDCEDVIDLTDTSVMAAHGVTSADMACPWKDLATRGLEPPSWAMTRRLFADGAAAAIVPSFAAGARRDDVNVIFWRWSRDRPYQVVPVDDDHRLPRDGASWTSR